MLLSPEARTILGFDYCLKELKPTSPYGQALKNQLAPYRPGQEAELNKELDMVAGLLSLLYASETEGQLLKIRHLLAQMPDWREPLNRVAAGGVLSDVELFGLKQNLLFLASIKACLVELSPNPFANVTFPDFPLLLTLLNPDKTDSPSFYLSDSFSERLADVRAKIREHQRTWNRLTENMRTLATEQVGLKFTPSGEISVSRHERNLRQRVESSKLFVVSRETYTDVYFELKPTPQELAVSAELERLEKQEADEAEKVRVRLSGAVRQESDRLRYALQILAKLDLAVSKAVLAKEWRATRPQLIPPSEGLSLTMLYARHPKVECDLAALGKEFTPISIALSIGASLITGANMGGKTVTLRTVGLLSVLTAYGMFVPAEYFAVSLFARVSILAGDYRAELTGLSRFGHEVAGLNELLTMANTRSLLLVDELASSTNPAEGSVLAQAVVEHLHGQQCLSLLTTHFDRLADLPGVAHWQVIGLSQVQSKELRDLLASESLQQLPELMDYRLQRVESPRTIPREALRVARYLGLPDRVLQRATELLLKGGDSPYEKD